ncbi:MAG: hypothetical protein AAGE84_13840 [Cyanobacteria bacterium P01_G01_bin.39]
MREFLVSVIASIIAAWLWEKHKNSDKDDRKLKVSIEEQRGIYKLLSDLKSSCEEIFGDLEEECIFLIYKKENKTRINFTIFLRIVELSIDLIQTAFFSFLSIKSKKRK